MFLANSNWCILLYIVFIRIATPLAFFAMHSWEIVALKTSGNHVRHIVSSQDDAVAGYWDADHDRPITRNTRSSNAQCTTIFVKKSPTFSLRKSMLNITRVSTSASNRNYLVVLDSHKTTVVPLCEWINHRAKRLKWNMMLHIWWGIRPQTDQTRYNIYILLISTLSALAGTGSK